MRRVGIGIVGCGNISGIYLENLTGVFRNTRVAACADLNGEAAKAASEKWDVPVMTTEELLSSPEVEIVVNLTTPQSHFELCKRALLGGKHVYVEKPLSLTPENGRELTELADSRGLMLGCAPDTFLGAGIQTCRKLLDDGYIGRPVGATAFMLCRGHEGWHPAPEFYYKKGGGPMFDMGPYYLTALISLLGGVSEVAGMTAKTFDSRTITSEPLFGKEIEVEVPTHVCGLLRFESGAVGTIITSFDVAASTLPRIEVYGTRGTLVVPDPNTFGGPVQLSTLDGGGFRELPLTHLYAKNSRGLGVADMARCVIEGSRDNRASGRLANHVLEIMSAIHASSDSGAAVRMQSPCGRPESLSLELTKGCV